MKPRVAILISGRGSNMLSLIQSAVHKQYPVTIALVASNRPGAEGLKTATQSGIKAIALDHNNYPDREAFERDLHKLLQELKIDLVCLAGFMRILSPWFVSRWPSRILNIHPSLLPRFKGLNTHVRALEAKETKHGCSVHLVTDGLDEGEVLGQIEVSISIDDTEQSLANKVLVEEHKLYPKILADYAMALEKLPNRPGN